MQSKETKLKIQNRNTSGSMAKAGAATVAKIKIRFSFEKFEIRTMRNVLIIHRSNLVQIYLIKCGCASTNCSNLSRMYELLKIKNYN